MFRSWMAGVLALTLAAGCGEEVSGSSSSISPELAARAEANGFKADLVYVLDQRGYTPAAGGSGVFGNADYQGIYTSDQGVVKVTVARRGLTADQCPRLPVIDRTTEVTCTEADKGFFRTSGDQHELALLRGPHLVRITGTLDRADLEKTAAGIRPATAKELEALLPPLPGGVPRGDLPKNGDGAPINTVGPGG
jgi:hypothetical protein